MFLGYIPMGEEFMLMAIFKDAAGVPAPSTTTPFFRIYGVEGLLPNGTGPLTIAETGAVTGATNANPIVITSANHGLSTGQRVTISGVVGNTNANGTFTITVIDPNTFSLNGVAGNAPYTGGGTWTTTGLYAATITPTEASGYARGEHYDVVVYATLTGVVCQQYRFGVV